MEEDYMSEYHEPVEELQPKDRDIVRALNSLKEEIEAINWYHQRVAAATDPELKKVLAHNRDEEIEHACMAMEWLRRNMPAWDEEMRTYFFTDVDITSVEEGEESQEDDQNSETNSIAIGTLKNK
jgi:ferritin-like protein